MATFKEALIDQIRNNFCNFFHTAENGLTFLQLLGGGPLLRYPLTTLRMGTRLLCNREPPSWTGPPFQGGQCYVLYNWAGTQSITRRSTGVVTNTAFTRSGVAGKIGVVVVTEETDSGFPVYRSRIPSTSSTGVITYTDLGTVRRDVYFAPVWSAITVTRQDGLPDNCGNLVPSPTINPQPTTPTNITITYVDNSSTTINVTASIIYAPIRVNVEGDLIIPFRVTVANEYNYGLNGDINFNTGDINVNFGNPNLPPSTGPLPDDYKSPDDVPTYPPTVPNSVSPPSSDPPQNSTNEVIRACIVTVTGNTSRATVIDQGTNPDIYAPNLGFVQFAIAVDNAVAWTADIPIKNYRQFVTCPWDAGAIQVRGTPQPGVTWTITPVRAKIEEPIRFS